MSIVYKLFRSGDKCYVYDRNRDAIINIGEEDYQALSKTDSEEKQNIIAKYQSKGFLLESYLKSIEHPATFFLEAYKERHITEMILQVTQDCNLRCGYCFYVNEEYLGRKYAHKNMSFEVAEKAMDYYIGHSTNQEMTLAFYGGEPLLRMDLVKHCITYMGEKVKDREVKFVFTTNGTLLTLDIARYFCDKNVSIMISLDGTRDNHNVHRVFSDGSGSFDIIMKNLRRIKDELPGLFDRIHFNCVVTPKTDYKEVREYFEYDELLKDSLFSAAMLQDNYVKDEHKPIYDDKLYVDMNYGTLKAMLYFMGRLEMNDISLLFRGEIHNINKALDSLQSSKQLPEISHHGGPCIAGSKRLFVDIAGRFFPCERVSEDSKIMNIGTIKEGVSVTKVDYLINVGKISAEKCLNCWIFHHCKICPSEADNLEVLDEKKKFVKCRSAQYSVLSTMQNICMIKQLRKQAKAVTLRTAEIS